MLGAINGNPLNLAPLNSEGAVPIRVGDLVITQASATTASAGVVSLNAAAALVHAAHALEAAATNAMNAANGYNQAAQILAAAAAAAVGSSLASDNAAQGFGADSTGAIAALLDALAGSDTLESSAEAEAIKAVLDMVQQAQTLAAAGTVSTLANAGLTVFDQAAAGTGAAAVASMAQLQDGNDTMASLLRMLLAHRLGGSVDAHDIGGQLTARPAGSGLSAYGPGAPVIPGLHGSSLTVH